MPYADLTNVQALMAKFPLNGTSKPTSTQAESLIEQVSAEIDGVISGAGYAVPVAAPSWFVDSLKLLNAYGATALILRSMFPQSRGADDSSPAEYTLYEFRYKDGIKRLKTGESIPPDAVQGAAGVGPSTYFTRNADVEEHTGDIAEPLFKRDMVL